MVTDSFILQINNYGGSCYGDDVVVHYCSTLRIGSQKIDKFDCLSTGLVS